MMEWIAQTDAGGVSGELMLKIIGAIFSGILLLLGGRQLGKKEAQESNVTLKKPVPTILTRSEAPFATQPDLEDHVVWTRAEFQRVWGQFGVERTMHNNELTAIHERINQQAQATATIKGSMEEIAKNVAQLLHLALNGKTPPRNPRQ